ncbi:GDSL-type esterase/lipase family protein [Akkermansiaceae bacterium]|nr:GDSL-type esterase/lipase family protein [Akkermansiaceae bacterium]MDB4570740.1 GDSL-type esterase/lipase family protein [Akkermansiaceae bacterium]
MRALLLLSLLTSALSAAPERWAKDMSRFEWSDLLSPPPQNAHLFVGSSSIRKWDLKSAFPYLITLNRGFGGSELEDSFFYADRIIIPHRPKVIFLYAGENDISREKTAQEVAAEYSKFVARIRNFLPKVPVVFISIKPSIARWSHWPEMEKANRFIEALTFQNPGLHYLDIASPMIPDGQKPATNLFADDGIHLSPKGYKIWTDLVQGWVNEQSSRPKK